MTDVDIPGLLRALAEQQTALLAAHAESMRVQRVLIERLTTTSVVVHPPESATSAPSPATNATTEDSAVATVAPAAPGTVDGSLESQPADPTVISAEPEAVVAESAPVMDVVDSDRPVGHVVGGTGPGRSDRYYRSAAPQRPAPDTVSLQQLNVLRAIQSVGDPGHLVLTFGPHAGETLGQIAQNDLEYLRQLARTAQRADVRAAAARLMAAMPSDPPEHRKATSQRSRRGR